MSEALRSLRRLASSSTHSVQLLEETTRHWLCLEDSRVRDLIADVGRRCLSPRSQCPSLYRARHMPRVRGQEHFHEGRSGGFARSWQPRRRSVALRRHPPCQRS